MAWKMPVILASASPRRRELLAGLGISFRVVISEVEEATDDGRVSAPELAGRNAAMKAEAAARQYPDALVIGADTVVECGGEILGKPADDADAVRMLKKLSGREHRVVTAVSLRGPSVRTDFAEITRVRFRRLTGADIREYLRLVKVSDKAGAYAVQEHGERIVERLDGSLSNVIGLPAERLKQVLEKLETGDVR